MDTSPFLGLEIGGTKLQLGAGFGDGRLLGLERRAIDPGRGAAGILTQIEAAMGPLLDRLGSGRGRPTSIGVGFGGPVDAGRGVVIRSNQVAGWDGFPLSDWLRSTFGLGRAVVENDADTAALGEALAGAGRGRSPVLYVTVGSGVGGGLIVDGRIYRGSGSGATEIGQLWVDPPRPDGIPGHTVESMASGWSIAARARSRLGDRPGPLLDLAGGDPARITTALVAEAARGGDPGSRGLIAEAGEALALGLAHAVNLLAPARIILGGGVSLMGEDLWIGPIRERLDRLAFSPFRGTYDLLPASLGEEVVVHGAIALARGASA